ncbi:MAG TPA: SDR family oxidoreductase [Chlamydiales bacterium]|nr:SDR family oxidoreductase [Chlamydiales bacterium]
MQRAKGKVVVVTGGTSGIGQGIAEKFVREGAKVVVFARRSGEVEGALFVQGDVSRTEDLKRLFTTTKSHFGKIDVLIANAGVGTQMALEDVTERAFDTMVDINYRGLFFTVKYALDFLNHPSSIVLISSIAAYGTVKRHSVYSSTKAAVSKLAQNFSFDLAEKNIRVNSISPGYIRTPIFEERIQKDPDYLESRKQYIPLKRIGTPEDIANAAFFLSSDEASFITGADLVVDGGYLASYPLPD